MLCDCGEWGADCWRTPKGICHRHFSAKHGHPDPTPSTSDSVLSQMSALLHYLLFCSPIYVYTSDDNRLKHKEIQHKIGTAVGPKQFFSQPKFIHKGLFNG